MRASERPLLNLKALTVEMERILSVGAKAVKMKIGRFSFRENTELVRVTRETIDPDVALLADADINVE